jgi:hypothetical protein
MTAMPFDVWETDGYVGSTRPFDVAWGSASVRLAGPVVDEHDVDMLTGADEVNLKVRHRENR